MSNDDVHYCVFVADNRPQTEFALYIIFNDSGLFCMCVFTAYPIMRFLHLRGKIQTKKHDDQNVCSYDEVNFVSGIGWRFLPF